MCSRPPILLRLHLAGYAVLMGRTLGELEPIFTVLCVQAADDGVKPAGQAAKDAVNEAGKKIPEPGQAESTTKVCTNKAHGQLCGAVGAHTDGFLGSCKTRPSIVNREGTEA